MDDIDARRAELVERLFDAFEIPEGMRADLIASVEAERDWREAHEELDRRYAIAIMNQFTAGISAEMSKVLGIPVTVTLETEDGEPVL